MSVLDQYAKQISGERRTKTAGTKLEASLYNKFVKHCNERGLNTSEALRFLVIELLKEPTGTKVNQIKEDRKPEITQVSKEKTTGHLQPFTVNGQVPCPLCDKWMNKKSYPRHCRDIHNITSGYELIQSHLEKVNQMVAQQRKKTEQ